MLLGQASHLSACSTRLHAEAAYRRVLQLDPDNALAHLGLAVCFDLTNRTEELPALVRQAEERGVGPDALSFIRAFDHRRAKRFAEGLAAMEQVPDELETVAPGASASANCSKALDATTKRSNHIEQMNELLSAAEPQPNDERAANYRNMRSRTP